MPPLRKYHLFISHSWTYEDAYNKLVEFFHEHPNFDWKDISIPKNDPIHNADNDAQLYNAIKGEIANANCVVMLAGLYANYSRWMSKEIEISNKLGKPIIGVEGWGAQRSSQEVRDNAREVVRWQSSSIVDAIRRHAI